MDINFLHYAILMFVICSLVLVVVSLMGPAPERRRLAGLTFATVREKIEIVPVHMIHKPPAETPAEHRINVIFSLVLVTVIVSLWIYFR